MECFKMNLSLGENNAFRYFQKFKNRVSAYAEINHRAAIEALISTQLFSRQFYKSGAEAEEAIGVRARADAVVVEHARAAAVLAAATAAATAAEQAFA